MKITFYQVENPVLGSLIAELTLYNAIAIQPCYSEVSVDTQNMKKQKANQLVLFGFRQKLKQAMLRTCKLFLLCHDTSLWRPKSLQHWLQKCFTFMLENRRATKTVCHLQWFNLPSMWSRQWRGQKTHCLAKSCSS